MNQEIGRVAQQKQKQQQRLIEIGVIIAIAIILGVIMPLALPAFRLKLLGRFLSLSIVALGIDLIWGYTGLLSLGHGIFFSLGGYALAMYLQLQLPEGRIPDFFMLYGVEQLPWFWEPFYSFPFTLVAIFLIPGIVAAILGYLVFRNRIKGVYFSILTQAALLVFFHLFNGQQKYINGSNGLKTDTTMIFGTQAGSPAAQLVFYELSILLIILIYLLCRWLTSGRFGRLLVAIRDDENRVRFSGYDPTGFKVLVFAISGAIAGIAGALYTVQSGIITPSFMEVAFSIEMVIWVAVGGRATLVGAILGTVLVRLGQTFLSEQFPQVWLFFQGALFLIVVTVLPSGIVGWLRTDGWEYMRSLLGFRQPIMTYPQLEEDPELQLEREELES
ncbi:MAG: urea ABC transporter permease subunit UrtC [Limnospira sp. PMC 1291.21]|uniref:Urea ABC transporter permease subunit UrtC n=1 Tax=Limnospira fusiformis PMC 851.14 TaxID=2219512 RepID=A0ABU9ESB9_LIMFS|nr:MULTISPECIES: urea ABC transporter permease subunit UrtC [Limnospira]MDC0836070.1 urea ABC transporter permease subunit UrtC [Limnoraphis robusta]MDY7054249.1 urea ABC transporter permease subunit UrtC [Limnospira fusiformis LS22]QJB28447.1 urea ABC transporter permease subunit UrtC [Limnospira fusiformis SAG 85.79]UWU51046.1 urea ABC transporter membrane protein [Arthrospira platensis C1]MDT9178638.1 urea ABC transporter permease subunit UrtC [Limnospira sp. PMC 1238.20]